MATASREGADLAGAVRRLAAPVVDGMRLEIVEVTLRRHGRGWRLRLDIEKPGPVGVGIEDCRRVSEALDPLLEEADLLTGSYVLEVSSPGVDRPIRTDDDLRRNTGRRVVVETEGPDGRRRILGALEGYDASEIRLRDREEREVRVPREAVVSVRQAVEF